MDLVQQEQNNLFFFLFFFIHCKKVVILRVSDLQAKDVVSLVDGRKLGRIVDIEIDATGSINYFVVEPRKWFRFWKM